MTQYENTRQIDEKCRLDKIWSSIDTELKPGKKHWYIHDTFIMSL